MSVRSLLAELLAISTEFAPMPVHNFPMSQAADAFRFMAQAKHTGKIVLTNPDDTPKSLSALMPPI